MRRLVMDVDTGIDDALALLYAVAHPQLELIAVSCVSGNAPLPQVVINTCTVLELAGASHVPVSAGAARPLLNPAVDASHVHGADGMGDLGLAAPTMQATDRGAVDALYEVIRVQTEPLTLVTTAPQTNIALLLTQHPDVAGLVDGIVFMGGSAGQGNATAVAEYNVWADPEAAAIVLNSGATTAMYGLDVFDRLSVAQPDAEGLARHPHRAAQVAGELLLERRRRSDPDWAGYTGLIGDAGLLVMLTDPELFTVERHPVQVNLTGIGRGQTIVDRRAGAGQDIVPGGDSWPVAAVALDLDVPQAAAAFVRTIRSI